MPVKRKAKSISVKEILSPGTNPKHRFVEDYKVLARIVDDLKRMGYRIVLTQGVYDLIHEGHALYLEKALAHGDLLIVGVDSDELTRKRKGPGRPIVPQKERIQMLLHLRHVSIVTLRHANDGLGKLIEVIRPNVLVTSETTKDFKGSEVARYKKHVGRVIVLPPQAQTSTTARIRTLTIDGADTFAKEVMKGLPELIRGALQKVKSGRS